MNTQKWIMSEGGPLIAVERQLQTSWGGICRLTVAAEGASNDYDRPPERLNYLQTIALRHGEALIFGEGPLDTTIWQKSDKQFFVVRIIYCDPDFDLDTVMRSVDPGIFEHPVERMRFRFSTSTVLIFDSADDGSRPDVDTLDVAIDPGIYVINTIIHNQNDRTSLIIHEFVKED